MESSEKIKLYQKQWREDNKEKIKEYKKEYLKNNPTYQKEYNKKYQLLKKEEIRLRKKEYYKSNETSIRQYRLENKDKISEYNKKYCNNYYELNKEEILNKQKEYAKNNKERRNKTAKEKRKTCLLCKLRQTLRNTTNRVFTKLGKNKFTDTSTLLGADLITVKKFIEDKFQEGMCWENHGLWHIDHIVPLSSGKDEEDLRKLCHYTNLQPLWAIDNLIKGNKIL